MTAVPCNGCTACCRQELIFLHPEHGDIIEAYDTFPTINPVTNKEGHAIKHKDNGECVYLGENGCTIHDRAPVICREFDCRRWFLKFGDRAARRRFLKALPHDDVSREVFEAGRARLHTLKESV